MTLDALDLGVDLYEPGILEQRPYTWVLNLLAGMLNNPASRLAKYANTGR